MFKSLRTRIMVMLAIVSLLLASFSSPALAAYTAAQAQSMWSSHRLAMYNYFGFYPKQDYYVQRVFRYQAISGGYSGMYEPMLNRTTMDPAQTSFPATFDYISYHEIGHAYAGWYMGDWSEDTANVFAWCFGSNSARSLANPRFSNPPSDIQCSNVGSNIIMGWSGWQISEVPSNPPTVTPTP